MRPTWLTIETIRGSLVRPTRLKLASLAKKSCPLYTYRSLMYSLLSNDNRFKNIFYFTTASDLDYVAAIQRLPAPHYSLFVFIFLSFGIKAYIV